MEKIREKGYNPAMTIHTERKNEAEQEAQSSALIITREIRTTHSVLSVKEHLDGLLSVRQFVEGQKGEDAYVWENPVEKEMVTLHYYIGVTAVSLRRSLGKNIPAAQWPMEAIQTYADTMDIVSELAEAVGFAHLMTTAQMEFGVEGKDAAAILGAVIPVIQTAHSQENEGAIIELNTLEASNGTSTVLLTPVTAYGE